MNRAATAVRWPHGRACSGPFPADTPFGPWLLVLVAAGLVLFGLFLRWGGF
ncbi:DUF1206 domain-containing protein [Streptomyces sp. NPDC005202]|uniref:DUF1206 domain-containing protein n=1 Tax=Streptomyces sp. NPDC005202 TaxID=3157021 RepID=UPI0033B84D6F